MNVSALYPSISKELVYNPMVKTLKNSRIPWENVDTKQLGRYLATSVERRELEKHRIKECVPTAKNRTSLNSWINPSGRAKETDGDSRFDPSVREPTAREVRIMIAIAVATSVVTSMSNHYYSVGGKLLRQTDGGSIGSDLTGEVSRNVMTDWYLTFLSKLKKLGLLIDMYGRYVDDQLEILPPVNPRWFYCVKSRTMKFCKDRAQSDCDSPAIRTAKLLREIANSIEKCIQLTFDTPDSNTSGMIPVLDLQVWMEGNKVLHKFYKKDVSSKFTIL